MKRKSPIALFFAWMALALTPTYGAEAIDSRAASQSSGTIEGRVFNPQTGEYIRNAEVRVKGSDILKITEANGRYSIPNAPAGAVTLIVSYTGYQPVTASVMVETGATATRDFELQSSFQSGGEEVVRLGRFTVSGEREGTAKAIMEQRNSMNIKNVVASDTFSTMTEGNIGEVLQYLPGLHIRYSDGEPANAMMRGMHEKYGAILVDGVRMTGGGTRASELGAYSAYATDTIEFTKTISADMDADSPAGAVNMKSKSAFQRKGRHFEWQAYTILNSAQESLGRSVGPNDGKSSKTLPSLVLDYSDVYLDGKLGVLVNLSENNSLPVSSFLNSTYNTVPTAARPAPIVITQLTFGITPKIITRRGGGLSLEYKLSPHTTVALRGQIGWESFRAYQRALSLVSDRNNQALGSSDTVMLALPTANNATRFAISGSHEERKRLTYTVAPQVTYARNRINLDATVAYTYLNQYIRNGRVDGDRDAFTGATYQLFGVGFNAIRENPEDTRFDFQQTSGPDLHLLSNWRSTSLTNNLTRAQNEPTTKSALAQINVKFTTDWKYPTYFKAGAKTAVNTFASVNRNNSWTYVGPGRDRFTAELPVSVAFRGIEPLDGGNLFTDRFFQFPDREVLGKMLKTNPEYFVPNPTNETSAANLFPYRSSREYIDAGYIMANTQIGRLTLQGGLRYEGTETEGKIYELGALKTRSGSYDDTFVNAAARYRFKENLMMIASYSQSIQRAPLNSLAAVAAINEASMTGTIPNLNLKPESGDNYSVRLEKYFEPVGVFSVGVFMFRMKDYHGQRGGIPAEEIGLGDEYPNYFFTSTDNIANFTTKGIELEYRHQLSFLPGVFKGFGVFGNYTQLQRSDPDLALRAAPKFASGGISFRQGAFNVSLSGTWTSEYLQTATAYNQERLLISTNLGYRLTQRTSLFLTGRNLLKDPQSGLLRAFRGVQSGKQVQGSVWSIGIKGTL